MANNLQHFQKNNKKNDQINGHFLLILKNYFTKSLKFFPNLNVGTFAAGMLITFFV